MLETTAAVAIFALLCLFCLRLIAGTLHWSTLQSARNADAAAVGALTDRWRIEEDSAWAIFTPPTDVNGASNADYHEVDFFTRDGKNQSYFWSYTYDAANQTLTRYLYSAPGATPQKAETYSGITKFVAHTYSVTALQDSSTPVYSALYKNAVLQNGAVRFYPGTAPWIDGGNQITFIHVETASELRELQLSTQTAPSGFTIVLQYTPAPAATPTTGPLVTLGKIVFEPGALAYDAPAQRLARGLNALFGGGVASAQSATCSYAQLYLQNGSLDTNGEDGFNSTDGQGCVTDGSVRLWAREANYPSGSPFGVENPATNGCWNYVDASPQRWSTTGYSVITPATSTAGCVLQVYSTDRTSSNGGAANVTAVVIAPLCQRGSLCYADLTATSEAYEMKCLSGAVGPPCAGGGAWMWRDMYVYREFSSDDGGSTWTDLGATFDCVSPILWSTMGPPTNAAHCTPSKQEPSIAYSGTSNSWSNAQTGTTGGGAATWKPSNPPTQP
ncbi:MAG TPA: hypothetical protein VGZ02_11595 [Candidatus Baltobacteraceae bacterium]|nr:hypothetical protein [Candidatus Baltobacteraceae bacterium]